MIQPPPFPKAIVFDWDNTLVDNWAAITAALNKVRAMHGLETWTVDEAMVKSARPLRVSFPEWFGDKWESMSDIFYEHFRSVQLETLQVKEGAEALLRWLQEAGIPAFVVSTKKNTLLNMELDHLGWRPLFKRVVGSLDCKQDKPHRMTVDYALDAVGIEADNPAVWFVGDTHADVECALRSGCTAVIVGKKAYAEELGIRLHFFDCKQLKKWLYNWDSFGLL